MWHPRPFTTLSASMRFVVTLVMLGDVSFGQEVAGSASDTLVDAAADSREEDRRWPFVRGAAFDGHETWSRSLAARGCVIGFAAYDTASLALLRFKY